MNSKLQMINIIWSFFVLLTWYKYNRELIVFALPLVYFQLQKATSKGKFKRQVQLQHQNSTSNSKGKLKFSFFKQHSKRFIIHL